MKCLDPHHHPTTTTKLLTHPDTPPQGAASFSLYLLQHTCSWVY